MRIALLTDGIFPYVVGGMQRHSFYLAKYLLQAGHEVVLFHTNASDKKIEQLEVFSEEEKKKLQSIVIPFPDLGSTPGHYIRESYEYSRLIYAKLKKVLPVDFIYAKGFSGWETLHRKSQGDRLPPIGVNFHGYEMFQPAPSFREWLKYKLLLRAPVLFNVRNADVVFSYGGKITPLIESLQVKREKIIEIPAGIDPSWIRSSLPVDPVPPRRFIFVGRFERRKGLPELSKQLKRLAKHENFRFTFVGDIPMRNRLAGDRYHYEGQVTDSKELQRLLDQADVLVCPSYSEGMPNVILEAMARGVAVIATEVGAVPVAVNTANGWLVAPGDGDALYDALQQACRIDDKKLAEKRRAALDDAGKKFLWPLIAQQTEEELLKRTL